MLQSLIWIIIVLCIIKAIHSLIVVFKANDKNKVAQGMIDTGIEIFLAMLLFMFSRSL